MGLKLPSGCDMLTLLNDDDSSDFFPLGFIAFDEHQLGNGDYFGLYWPVGLEDRDPIVAETRHDAGAVDPMFSGLSAFLRATASCDEASYPEISLDEDPTSPLGVYEKARDALRQNHVEEAVALLESAISCLPEYTNALALLTKQYLRLGRLDVAIRTAVKTIISPPSFGRSAVVGEVATWLKGVDHPPEDLADDPVWCRRMVLTQLGGRGEKNTEYYKELSSTVRSYEEGGNFIQAVTCMMTYGEQMLTETQSMQERNSYSSRAHRQRLRELSKALPAGPRFLLR